MTATGLAPLSDARLIPLQRITDARGGALTVMESPAVPFQVRRVFSVVGSGGEKRGQHAHRECQQLLVCLAGVCEVALTDGRDNRTVRLETSQQGLYIPPSIWAAQEYGDRTTLLVLCDLPYAEADYIRDFSQFLQYRGVK